MAATGGLCILERGDQLRRLNQLVYNGEVQAIRSLEFSSKYDREKYLRDCASSFHDITNILDDAGNAKDKFMDSAAKAAIADDIYHYAVKGVNVALQSFRNYTVRQTYLGKIKDHAQDMLKTLATLGEEDVVETAILAKNAVYFKEATQKFIEKSQSFASSKQFSKALKERGVKFQNLVKEHQSKLGFKGAFEDLKDAEKIQVYDDIVRASGRGNVIMTAIDDTLAVAGIAVLLFALGSMVWDIYLAERPVETAARDAMTLTAGVAGSAIGTVVAEGIATVVEEALDVAISSVIVVGTGFIFGIALSFIISAAGGALIDAIFSSGGSNLNSVLDEKQTCHMATLPDGVVLARKIHHDG